MINHLLAIFLLMFVAKSTLANKCENVLMKPETFSIKEDQDIFVENLDIHGRPFNIQLTQSFKSITNKYPAMSMVIDKNDQNRIHEQSKKMTRLHLSNPQINHGLSINETFLQFIHKDFDSVLHFLSESKELSKDELLFAQGLLQVIRQKPKLIMVDDESQFHSESGMHRFAKTRGYPGDPIYFNSHQLKEITIDLIEVKEQKIELNSKVTAEKDATNLDLNIDLHYHFSAPLPEELNSQLIHYSEKSQFEKVLTIYYHELGHYLGMKDDPQQSLTHLANKLARVTLQDFQQIQFRQFGLDGLSVTSFKDFRQPHDRLFISNMGFLFDLSADLQIHLKEQLIEVPRQWRILNLRILPTNNQKSSSEVPSQFFEFEVEYRDQVNQPKLLTISYKIDLSAEMEYKALAQHRQLKHYMGPVEIRLNDQVFGIQLNQIETVQSESILQVEQLMMAKLKYEANQQIDFSGLFQLKKSETLIDYIEVQFLPVERVKAGVIEGEPFVIKSSHYEYIGSDRIIAHFKELLPQGLKHGQYVFEKFKIHFKNELPTVYRLKEKKVIQVVNQMQSTPQLSHYGFTTSNLVKYKKNRLLDFKLNSRLTNFKLTNNGVTIPLVFFVKNVGPMSEFRLTGQFITEGENNHLNHVYSFHEVYRAQQKGPLIQRIEVTQKGNLKQILVYLNVPKNIRSRFVHQLNIDSLYIRDRNLNELFNDLSLNIFTNENQDRSGRQ